MNTPHINLMIAGAQKAGTSSLLIYIGQHPDIVIHDELEFPYFIDDELYRQGYEHSYSRLFAGRDVSGKKLAAKSATLMYEEYACRRFFEHNPDALVTVMIRDPVRRAYSAYWHGRRNGYEPETTFEAALAAEHNRRAAGQHVWRKTAYVHNGIYLPHIARLMELFGTERVLVFTTDDLRTRPMECLQDLFRHACVDDSVEIDVVERVNTAARPRSQSLATLIGKVRMSRNGAKRAVRRLLPHRMIRHTLGALSSFNEKQFAPPPMAPETEAQLAEIFAQPNLALGEFLGRDLSHWSRTAPATVPSTDATIVTATAEIGGPSGHE